jgi:transposase
MEEVSQISREDELMKMERNQRQVAREQLVTAMLKGQSWKEVSKGSDAPLKRAMAYRLLYAVRTKGNVALQDGRHGHPVKLRGAARTFLEEYCRQAPSTPSSVIQTLLQERFSLSISTSQINRVRAALGVSNRRRNQGREKKRE